MPAPASLARALEGVDRAFLLTNSTEKAGSQQLAFVAAASQAGVKHIVKLSQFLADPQSPVRYLEGVDVTSKGPPAEGQDPNWCHPGVLRTQ